MDALIKNIKEKLSVDNLVEMMKDGESGTCLEIVNSRRSLLATGNSIWIQFLCLISIHRETWSHGCRLVSTPDWHTHEHNYVSTILLWLLFTFMISFAAKVIDNTHIKEEDVRRTLETIDTGNLIYSSELAEKLNEISELSKVNAEENTHSTSKIEIAKSTFGIFTKPPEKEKKKTYDDIQDNITAFLD